MRKKHFPVALEGMPFILSLTVLVLLFAFFGFPRTALVFLVPTVFTVWFFRNPERKVPEDEKAVISPADGRVLKVEALVEDEILGEPVRKISIFMNVFNVHVNRMPFSGTIRKIRYTPGKFLSANLDKASRLNERNAVLLETDGGLKILTTQIAGLIARRIVCWVEEGMSVKRGERFGMIRFGSRLEVFMPPDARVAVEKGDTVRAGETIIGYLP
ncbi:MAG TPA: phosphatidylserine decarboxylase family protein [Syntrophales bacterium]|nr:phosphatidylserine decarboxylase family protein [Syntrophales bacterium]HPX11410.1 phosphatidylserine decarboxylase family protein [Syntrophales bacterium]HQN78682.1 phosphatidylserine decarboxylase family protein [Syntrophales bacterium]HQQ26806.1 phosphatidylserine decarboxylase family protein [Syntrophales bacterium]